MKIGYARVSTPSQSLDMQVDALKAFGCQEIYTDITTGGKTSRPGLDKMMAMIRQEDTVVVWKLDRLGRNIKHLIESVTKLRDRNIGFKSLREDVDTTTPSGKMLFHMFCVLAEFERDLCRERTMEGLKLARARGRLGGRPRKMTPIQIDRMVKIYNERKIEIAEICKLYNISRNCMYKYIRADKARREAA